NSHEKLVVRDDGGCDDGGNPDRATTIVANDQFFMGIAVASACSSSVANSEKLVVRDDGGCAVRVSDECACVSRGFGACESIYPARLGSGTASMDFESASAWRKNSESECICGPFLGSSGYGGTKRHSRLWLHTSGLVARPAVFSRRPFSVAVPCGRFQRAEPSELYQSSWIHSVRID